MTDNNAKTNESAQNPTFRARIKQRAEAVKGQPRLKSTPREKIKTGLAVIGVVTVAGVVAGVVSNRKTVTVEATLPDVEVNSDQD